MKLSFRKVPCRKLNIVLVIFSSLLLLYSILVTINVNSVRGYYEFIIEQREESARSIEEKYATPTPALFPTPTLSSISNKCPEEIMSDYAAEKEDIIKKFSSSTTEVEVYRIIKNYAYIGEHGIEPNYHGGGWGVVKKECGKWSILFRSADENWCGIEESWGLPKGLLEDCVPIPSDTSQ